eukprot:PhF_6_TR21655/c0_g1_i2/m.30850
MYANQDIIEGVAEFCDVRTILSLSQTSSYIHNVTTSESVWKYLLQRDFALGDDSAINTTPRVDSSTEDIANSFLQTYQSNYDKKYSNALTYIRGSWDYRNYFTSRYAKTISPDSLPPQWRARFLEAKERRERFRPCVRLINPCIATIIQGIVHGAIAATSSAGGSLFFGATQLAVGVGMLFCVQTNRCVRWKGTITGHPKFLDTMRWMLWGLSSIGLLASHDMRSTILPKLVEFVEFVPVLLPIVFYWGNTPNMAVNSTVVVGTTLVHLVLRHYMQLSVARESLVAGIWHFVLYGHGEHKSVKVKMLLLLLSGALWFVPYVSDCAAIASLMLYIFASFRNSRIRRDGINTNLEQMLWLARFVLKWFLPSLVFHVTTKYQGLPYLD